MILHSIDTNPRKTPRQERSKQTVAVIMEAVAQVLIRHGYENTTTARVAERAGTSVGSLYQYFPNKEALVAALVEEHADKILVEMRIAIVETQHVTLADGLRAMIRAAADAHLSNPALHKVLSEQVPHVGKHGLEMEVHRKVAGFVETLLHEHADEIMASIDFTVASVVIETAVEALMHKAVIDRGELLAGSVFEDHALQLVTGYLGILNA